MADLIKDLLALRAEFEAAQSAFVSAKEAMDKAEEKLAQFRAANAAYLAEFERAEAQERLKLHKATRVK